MHYIVSQCHHVYDDVECNMIIQHHHVLSSKYILTLFHICCQIKQIIFTFSHRAMRKQEEQKQKEQTQSIQRQEGCKG